MPYSSVWTRVSVATAASMIGWIVICCTLASMCRTTGPPRWIRPRMGGLSFSSVPRPGAPAGRGRGPNRPLWRQPGCWGFGREATAQMFRHRLHVRPTEPQFRSDLPVREVQAHEGEAQYPHPQRLMVSGPRRAAEVVKAPGAGLTAIALPMRLGVVAPIADHRTAAAAGAAHALRPAVLAHEGEALGVIQQSREVDQFRCRPDRPGSLRVRAAADQRLPSLITAEAPCNAYPLLCPSPPR